MHDTPVFGTFGVPAVPPPTLDPYLDAAARCFARHGLRRTRVTDIADEVGVSRVTVYRQIGTVENAARLLLARELDRLVSSLVPQFAVATDADAIASVIASAVEFTVDHPVLAKVLRDEPELVGVFIMGDLHTLIERLLVLADPLVQRLEDLARGSSVDVGALAEWLARVLVTMVVAPPKEPPDSFLRAVLVPILSRD